MIDDRDLTMLGFDFQMAAQLCRISSQTFIPGHSADGGRMLVYEICEGICGHAQRTSRPPKATRPRADGR